MLDFVIFAVTVVIFLIISVIYLYPGAKKATTIPGPEPIETLEGNFPEIIACGSLHEFLVDTHRHYGPIVSLWWGPRLAVSIASPELFKAQAKVFNRPAELFELLESLFGPGSIQFTNGSEGRERHSAYSRCFTHDSVSGYHRVFNKLAAEFTQKWASIPTDDHIPLREYMFAFTIKSILQACYGNYYNDDREVLRLRQSYDFCWSEMESQLSGDRSDTDGYRLEQFEKYKEVMHKSMQAALENRRANPPEDGETLFIDVLMNKELSESTTMSDLLTVFIAGFHTSGLLLTWTVYFLASHPDVQTKLYQEIVDVLGDEQLEIEQMKDLIYLEQVLNESLRCSRLAPWAARFMDVDIELGGHRVPAGTPVIQALGVVLHDPTIFPEPQKFDPERFSPENVKARSTYAFQPFGFAGKRVCPGYRFAQSEASVLLCSLLRKLEVKLVPGQVVIPEYGLVTKPKEEIWITTSPRK